MDEDDARRYRWLREQLEFVLASYQCESGRFDDAETSDWFLRTPALFRGTNRPPESLDAAIDAVLRQKQNVSEDK